MSDLEQQIRHPKLRRLFGYWDSRRGERAMPARRDLDPVDFAYALPGIVLIDVLHKPLRFRARLVGTMVVTRLGYDLTGHMIDELRDPTYRETILASYREVVAARRPSVVQRDEVAEGRSFRYEVLRLPLSSDGEEIDMLMTAQEYLP